MSSYFQRQLNTYQSIDWIAMATPLKELLERIPFFNSYLLLTYAKLLKL